MSQDNSKESKESDYDEDEDQLEEKILNRFMADKEAGRRNWDNVDRMYKYKQKGNEI
jgi:hypothetical protein